MALNEVHQELVTITNTTNFAKKGNYYSGTFNINAIRDIIRNEEFDTPVINTAITINKYEQL